MSSIAWPVLLAGAAAAVAAGLPGPGQARLAALSRGRLGSGGATGLGAGLAGVGRDDAGLRGLADISAGRRPAGGAGAPATGGSPAGRGPADRGAAGRRFIGPGPGRRAPGPAPAGRRAAGPAGNACPDGPPAGARPAAAAAAVALAYLSASFVVLLLAAGAALAGQAAWLRHRSRAAGAAERRAAGEACSALAAELRAGRAPAEALATAADLARGPSRAALRSAAAAARLGGDVPAALTSGVAGSSAPEVLRGLAACWQVCARAGSGLAGAVDRLAEGLRSAQVQEQAVQAALAGPRASAGLLAVLPLAGIGLAAGLGAQPLHVLLHTPVGVACLLAGVGLDVLGVWWTGRIVGRAGRGR